jgi:hypothetical protein
VGDIEVETPDWEGKRGLDIGMGFCILQRWSILETTVDHESEF